ncbi:hypothetical protein Q8F55_005530 [Vanrija albida]|uniref:Peptidase A1 domain-containing protein n=1 Tax=Vanrija albida TaxID=181172 RepID=A0ABR3Q280_9TREE
MLTSTVLLVVLATASAAGAQRDAVRIPINTGTEARYHADPAVRSAWARGMSAQTRRRWLPKRQVAPGNLTGVAEGLINWSIDKLYTAQVGFGTPPQVFDMHLDTGSADLYIYDKECTATACSKGGRYDASKSSTYTALELEPANITYGVGFTRGPWAADNIEFAGIRAVNHTFIRALDTDDTYATTNISGLMGFAWQNLSHQNVLPFWQDVIEQMADQRFSFYLQRNEKFTEYSTAGGELVIGGTNPASYTGDFHYVKSRTDFWSIPIDNLVVNGDFVATGPNNVNLANAAIDTGTSLIIGPEDKVAAIYAKVPGAHKATEPAFKGHWKFPCNTNFTFAFSFGGVEYPIPFRDLVMLSTGDDFNSAICMGSIYSIEGLSAGVNDWIIGDAFLKNVYTTFRYEPPAVGFAQLAPAYVLDPNARPSDGAAPTNATLAPNATAIPVLNNKSATLNVPTGVAGAHYSYSGTAKGPGNPDNTATISASYNQTAPTKSNIQVLSTSGVAKTTAVQSAPSSANAASTSAASSAVTSSGSRISAPTSGNSTSTPPASTRYSTGVELSGHATDTAVPVAASSGTTPPPRCRPKHKRAHMRKSWAVAGPA